MKFVGMAKTVVSNALSTCLLISRFDIAWAAKADVSAQHEAKDCGAPYSILLPAHERR